MSVRLSGTLPLKDAMYCKRPFDIFRNVLRRSRERQQLVNFVDWELKEKPHKCINTIKLNPDIAKMDFSH